MENWRASHRLLKYTFYHRRTNFFISTHSSNLGRIHNLIRSCELLQQDIPYQKRNFSTHFRLLRGYGNGACNSLSEVENGGFRIRYRNLVSMASITVRNQTFSVINSDDISYFKKILGESGVVQEEEKLENANTDWM